MYDDEEVKKWIAIGKKVQTNQPTTDEDIVQSIAAANREPESQEKKTEVKRRKR